MEVLSTKDLFQILLLIYEAEQKGEILDVENIQKEESTPFRPKIIGKLSFDPDTNYTIKLNTLAGEPFTKSNYKKKYKPLSLENGVYKLLIQPKFLRECIIKYNSKNAGEVYKVNPDFENVLGKEVFPTKEDILAEKYTEKELLAMNLLTLKGILTIIGKSKIKFESGDKDEDKKKKIVNVIKLWISEQKTIKAIIKHWPVIENNTSWIKVFNRLNLHPESKDIYEGKKDDENYLKCLGYIGILLDHLDRAEPLPTDLYGKCLNLSERIL